MATSPLEQFEVFPIVPLEIGGIDASFTNASLAMTAAVVISAALFVGAVRTNSLVPGRMQCVAEMLYEMVANMVRDNVGSDGRKYFPFIFTLFAFIFFGNLIGMAPTVETFTFTSHIIVNFGLAAVVFIGVTLIGLIKHGGKFFSLFLPHGVPLWLAPLVVPIELVSYLSRPISLSVRLFANMTVGHLILKVIAGFVVSLGIFGFVPFVGLVAIVALEFLIAVLQAYIFTVLTCIYLHDSLHLH